MKIYLFALLVALGGFFPGKVLAQWELQLDQSKSQNQDSDTCYNHELKNGDILKICVTEQKCSFGASSLSLSQESSSLRDDKKVTITVCQEQEGISQDSDREETEEDVSRPDHIPYEYFDPAWHGYDNNSQDYQKPHDRKLYQKPSYPRDRQESSSQGLPPFVEESSSPVINESEYQDSREASQFRQEMEGSYYPRRDHSSQSYTEQQRDLETQVRSRQGSTQGQIPDRPQVEILDRSRSAHTSDQETYGRPSIEPPEHSRGSSVPDHSHNGHNPRSTSPSDFGRSHR